MSCAKLLPYNGPRADEIEVEIRRLLSELLEQKIYTDKAAGFLLTLIMDSGYNAGNEEGTINDFSLPWRLRVMLDINQHLALGYKRWMTGFDEGAYGAFPAGELIFAERGEIDEDFWTSRWELAGGRIYGGRKIAMLADPVWQRISVYGQPWEPFDCIGATGQEAVSISEVEEFGVTWSEAMEFRPLPRDAFFYFRDLPDWLGEWPALQALAEGG